MAKRKPTGPSVLTANDILTGRIVWWSQAGWTESFDAALRAGDDAKREALETVGKVEEAENRVVGAVVIPLDAETGLPHGLREGLRQAGPSIPIPEEAAALVARAA